MLAAAARGAIKREDLEILVVSMDGSVDMPMADPRLYVMTGTTTVHSLPDSSASGLIWDESTPSAPTPAFAATISATSKHLENSISISTTLTTLPSDPSSSPETTPSELPGPTSSAPFGAQGDNSTHVQSSSSPALYIALIVLSVLILITILVLAWLAWRRRRREKLEIEEATQRYQAHGGTASSSPAIPKSSYQFSNISLTGPTLVSDANSSARTLVPNGTVHGTPVLLQSQSGIDQSRQSQTHSRPASSSWPLRSISRHRTERNVPPAPPPKYELQQNQQSRPSPTAPPSPPTIAAKYSLRRFPKYSDIPRDVHIPAASRIELHDLSPVSPLSADSEGSRRDAHVWPKGK